MAKEKRLNFTKEKDIDYYKITNQKDEELRVIEKVRVGSYMHWCYCPRMDMLTDIFISAGCMDEIRECMKNPEKYTEN